MYHHISHVYSQLFPENPKLKTWIKPYIHQDKNAIDLGCGTGRLTNLIDTLGMNVLGVDLDQEMIEVAKTNYPHLNFIVGDMVQVLNVPKTYHLMTCFGNTLPHLNLPMLKKFFSSVALALDEQGVLVVQLLNYKKILKERPKHLKDIQVDDIHFERTYTYMEHSILFKTTLTIDGLVTEGSTTIYPYQKEELEKALEHANLQSIAFGNLESKPFDADDYYLYLVISKR